MATIGVAPLDPASAVGQVRLVIGDDDPENLDPAQVGLGGYNYFSDDAIIVALSLSDGGITRAVSILVKQLALSLVVSGQSIAADDFRVNTLGKGKDLLQVAQSYEAQADAEDARGAHETSGAYQIVNTRLNAIDDTFAGLSGLFNS